MVCRRPLLRGRHCDFQFFLDYFEESVPEDLASEGRISLKSSFSSGPAPHPPASLFPAPAPAPEEGLVVGYL